MDEVFEIRSVKEEKDFLSKHLKPFYEIIHDHQDEFRGTKEKIISIPLRNTEVVGTYSKFSLELSILIKYENNDMTIGFSGFPHKRKISRKNENMSLGSSLESSLENIQEIRYLLEHHVHEKMNEIIFLTKDLERFILKEPFNVPTEALSSILSSSTRFRAEVFSVEHNDNFEETNRYHSFTIEGKLDFPFSKPYNVVRYIAYDGNLPDEEIDELYDDINKELLKNEEKHVKKVTKDKLKAKEAAVEKLNLCEFATLSAIITNPTSIKEISDLEKYCKDNNISSSLLKKINDIPKKYDTARILKDIERCKKKSKANSNWAKYYLFVAILGIVFSVYSLVIQDTLYCIIGAIAAVWSFNKQKNCMKDITFDDYTSEFINNIFAK